MATRRYKVSEEEIKRNTLPLVASNNFDEKLLEAYLRGKTIKALASEHSISQGEVGLKIKVTMNAMVAFLNEKDNIDERMIREPLKYKVYWIQTVAHFKALRHIRNPHNQFAIFLLYFKQCSKIERQRMFQELENYIQDDEASTS